MDKNQKMRKILEENSLDAIYITDQYNIRYCTGFSGSTGFGIITKDKALFFTDFRYKEQAQNEVVKNGYTVINVEKKYDDSLINFVKENGIKRLGIEDKNITLSTYNKLRKDMENVEFVALDDKLVNLRFKKEIVEIEKIKRAGEIADIAFKEILKDIREGIKESEISAKLEYIMKMNGASDRSFDTIVASGYRSAMPHGVASDKTIARNEFVKLDFGCYYDGYVSDITRTVFYGDAITDKHHEIYKTVLEAQLLAISKAKAGMTGKELDSVARDYIKEKGYEKNFGHGLGHGIGLEIHEGPTVGPRGETVLEEGMVVTIEPGIYIEGFGGVRIEDDVIIKENGCEIITKSPKELIIINLNSVSKNLGCL